MTIDVLNYCVDLAAYLSFTKVAEKNHITQQTLSQQIINLERDLGVKLFERNNRSVKLTPAGEVFIAEISPSLLQMELAIKRTQLFAVGTHGSLHIGYNGPNAHQFIADISETFVATHLGVELDFKHSTYSNIVSEFKGGAFDIIVVGDFEQFDENIYNVKHHCTGYINAVFGKSHPLASRDEVYPEELLAERYICLNISDNKLAHMQSMDRIRKICGQLPPDVKFVQDTETVSMYVESGLGYMLMTSSLKKTYKVNSVKYVQIHGSQETMPLTIVWKKDNDNPALALFLDSIKMTNSLENELSDIIGQTK